MRAVAHFDETEEIEKPTPDDDNKTFRTRFVVAWLTMNAALGKSLHYFPHLGPRTDQGEFHNASDYNFATQQQRCVLVPLVICSTYFIDIVIMLTVQSTFFVSILAITFFLASIRFFGTHLELSFE